VKWNGYMLRSLFQTIVLIFQKPWKLSEYLRIPKKTAPFMREMHGSMFSCSSDFWGLADIWMLLFVTPNFNADDAGRVGRESTPDESRLFAGVDALSTWAVMRMTDSCEFQFYARRTPRRADKIAEKCFARMGRRRFRTRCVFMGALGMSA